MHEFTMKRLLASQAIQMRVEQYISLGTSFIKNLVGLNNIRQRRKKSRDQKYTKDGRETKLT